MKRARVLVMLFAVGLGGGALACGTILGLEERTLREDAGLDAAPPDAGTDACVSEGFCACSQHDFCEDFDSYTKVGDISKRWTNTLGYPPTVEFQGSSTFDGSSPAASPPNALQVRTDLAFGKAGAAARIIQIDGRPLHKEPIIGVKVTLLLRVDALDPDDAAGLIGDSGSRELVSVMALVSGSASDGVGVLLSENGGYVGYALNVNDLTKTSVAQGLVFSTNRLVPPSPIFLPFTVIVAPRNSAQVGNVTCTAGPILTTGDGGAPDADVGPNPLVVVVMPPKGAGSTVCEVLGGALLDPLWVQAPLLTIGSVQSGLGSFQAAFDNITVDFLTQ